MAPASETASTEHRPTGHRGHRRVEPTLPVPVVRLDPDLPLPGYARSGDAGADLVARTGVTLAANGGRALVPTGVALAIPAGLRRLRPAAERPGPAARGDLSQHPRPHRLGLPGRAGRPAGQHRSRDRLRGAPGRPDRPAGHPAGGDGGLRRGGASWPRANGASAASGRRAGSGMERLTGLDGAFLSLESPTTHLHILGALVFDPTGVAGGVDFWRIRSTGGRPGAPGAAVPQADGRGPLRAAAPGHGRRPRLRPRLPRAPGQPSAAGGPRRAGRAGGRPGLAPARPAPAAVGVPRGRGAGATAVWPSSPRCTTPSSTGCPGPR